MLCQSKFDPNSASFQKLVEVMNFLPWVPDGEFPILLLVLKGDSKQLLSSNEVNVTVIF